MRLMHTGAMRRFLPPWRPHRVSRPRTCEAPQRHDVATSSLRLGIAAVNPRSGEARPIPHLPAPVNGAP